MADQPIKTTVDLDWPRLLAALSGRCATPIGSERAHALDLLTAAEPVAARLAEVSEIRGLLDAGKVVPLDGLDDIRPHLDRASRHAVLSPEELIAAASVLRASRRLAAFFSEHREQAPRVGAYATPANRAEGGQLRDLEELLASCFEDDGTISDRASPELASLRSRVRSLSEKLSKTIGELIERYSDVLQDQYFTVRDDRYVLPIRTDAHRRVHGIVHGHSGSGQTIYVEPREITTSGNDLMIARTEVAREEQRVLVELSEEVRLRIPPITAALEGATIVDLRTAAARLAQDLDGHVPEICGQEGRAAFRQARHPLMVLDGIDVVPNSIDVEPGGVLVVSGPNGGGKTVALKTVGLVLLMLRGGLPVPCAPDSRVPIVETIFTDMGDDQSLEQSLSTFAAHMTNIARLLAEAGPHDVVLLDELAGGTDPAEGAALAVEIARALAERGAAVMCTTHYGSFKLLAMQLDDFSGASLGFDRENLAPTYLLSSGAPGVSGAFAAAQRYGLPVDVVEAARARMGEDRQRVSELMEQLDAERDRVRVQADALVEERTSLKQARRAMERERKDLERQHKERIEREGKGLLRELQSAREKVRSVEARMRKRRLAEKEAKQAAAKLDAVNRELAPGGKLASALDEDAPPGRAVTDETELKVGLRVYVPNMRAEGEVVEPPNRHKVRVALGRVTVTVKVADLLILDSKKPQKPKRPAPIQFDAAADAEVPAMTPGNTLDLRGERVDDAVREVDKFIDRGLSKGWDVAFFIHGHGTGALRQALRKHFDESPYVSRHKAGERRQGGDGVTVIWLQ